MEDAASQIECFEVESQNAKNLEAECKEAERQGDLETASIKARAITESFLKVLGKFKSPRQPVDSDGTETLKSMLSLAVERAKLLVMRAKSSTEQQRAKAEASKRAATAELLTTEDIYHRRLQRMRNSYLDPLEAELCCLHPLLSREQIAGVFGNIDSVLQHSAILLNELRLALNGLNPDSPQDDVATTNDSGRPRLGP